MNCPSCEHEAPAQGFGNTLQCSNCGCFYEKELRPDAVNEPECQQVLERRAAHEPPDPSKAADDVGNAQDQGRTPLIVLSVAAVVAVVLFVKVFLIG